VFARIGGAFGFGLGLFFCLSAYLICELLLREKHKYQRIDIKAFYIRRVLRIWPLYLVGIAIGTGIALHNHSHRELGRFVAYLLLAGNWFCVFFGWSSSPMIPLWSISIEEQFYLVWPGLASWLKERGLIIVSLLFIVLANATLLYLGLRHSNLDHTVACNSFVQLEMFGAGLLLCLLLRGRMPKIPAVARPLLLLAGVGCWLIAGLVFDVKDLANATGPWQLIAGYGIATAGCGAIVLGLLGISAGVLPGWMVYLGKISYGLYVYHLLMIHLTSGLWRDGQYGWLRMVVALAATIAVSAISFELLEKPFLRLKHRFEKIQSRPA